jgi:sterol desaturase/sphingolipid hydroxylase (fatty acid hydroxylase superfamily)
VSAGLVAFTASHLHAALDGRGLVAVSWPSHASLAVRIALAFFTIELFSYWLHRAAHHVEFLWRFHSTHHVLAEVTGLKALRTHPMDNVFFCIARTAPLILLGAGPEELLGAAYFAGILSVLSHANIDVSSRGLGWLVNLPQFHRVHHSSDLAESRSNFGCHTVLWDRVFGTFRSTFGGTLEVGVTPVGPRTLWQELAWPFYRAIN